VPVCHRPRYQIGYNSFDVDFSASESFVWLWLKSNITVKYMFAFVQKADNFYCSITPCVAKHLFCYVVFLWYLVAGIACGSVPSRLLADGMCPFTRRAAHCVWLCFWLLPNHIIRDLSTAQPHISSFMAKTCFVTYCGLHTIFGFTRTLRTYLFNVMRSRPFFWATVLTAFPPMTSTTAHLIFSLCPFCVFCSVAYWSETL